MAKLWSPDFYALHLSRTRVNKVYCQFIATHISVVTNRNLSYGDSHLGTSRFIHPNTSIISEWISLTRLMFQHIASLWKTRLRNARKRFNGAETFLRCLFAFGIKGNALRKSFHKIRSYSLLSNETQKPNVSSATIFEGVICSCLPDICFAALVIYLLRLDNPGVFGNTNHLYRPSVLVRDKERYARWPQILITEHT